MRNLVLSFTLTVGFALVGCAAPMPFPSVPKATPPQVQPEFEPGDLVLRLRIGDSQTLQAGGDPVLVYDVADVAYLVILPFVKEGEAFVPMSSAGKPTTEEAADRLKVTTTDRHQTYFVFKNLPPDQTYRFQARAYDAEHNLISQDAASTTDVTFTRVEYMNTPTLQLKLKDKPFMGATKATVRFPDGLQGTDHVVVELFKKGPPEVMVGKAVRIEAADFSSARTVLLGGLAPDTTYVLKAEARGADETVLASGSVEWVVNHDRSLADKEIALSFPPEITTFAGVAGSPGHDAGAVDRSVAKFNAPTMIAAGPDGAIYVADSYNCRIRRIDAAGSVTNWVGNGLLTIKAGNGTSASIGQPRGLAFDSLGNLFVVNTDYGQILKVTPTRDVSVYAGVVNNEANPQSIDGPIATARFAIPQGLYIDALDNLYVTDLATSTIRKISDGMVTTLAGGSSTYTDLAGNSVTFEQPTGLTMDPDTGKLYLADMTRIWSIDPATGAVTAVAGNGQEVEQDGPVASASFKAARAIHYTAGTLYVGSENALFAIKDGIVRVLAGSKTTSGSANGIGEAARFNHIYAMLEDEDGSLLMTDLLNSTIRRVVFPSSK